MRLKLQGRLGLWHVDVLGRNVRGVSGNLANSSPGKAPQALDCVAGGWLATTAQARTMKRKMASAVEKILVLEVTDY